MDTLQPCMLDIPKDTASVWPSQDSCRTVRARRVGDAAQGSEVRRRTLRHGRLTHTHIALLGSIHAAGRTGMVLLTLVVIGELRYCPIERRQKAQQDGCLLPMTRGYKTTPTPEK